MAEGTLRGRVEAMDAARFVGRTAELGVVAELLSAEGATRILYVHGPAGIGKSALLRAAARTAAAGGYDVAAVDGRTLPAALDLIVEAVLGDRRSPRCIVVDEADALGGSLEPLRDALLDALEDDARLIFAGRTAPAPSWREHGLHRVVVDLALRPLDRADATALLEASGVDAPRRDSIAAWSKGSPLALTVAATLPGGFSAAAPDPGTDGADRPRQPSIELEARLTTWLAGRPMLEVDPEVLEVAAIVRIVDARLLAAALPGRPTREAMRRLAELPVMQRLGGGATMHPVLAAAIRGRLRAEHPLRYRALLRRIVEHLGLRARLGEAAALLEMSQFIEDPAMRLAIASDPSETHYPDAARPGEFEAFARRNGYDAGPGWAEVAAWQAASEVAFVIRRNDGAAVLVNGYTRIAAIDGSSAGELPRAFLAAAAATGVDPERSFAGVTLFADVPYEDRAEASRIASGAFVERTGMVDLQAMLMHFGTPDRSPGSSRALNDTVPGVGPLQIVLADLRPFGAVGFVEAIVLREQGFAPPADGVPERLAEDGGPVGNAWLRDRLDEVFGTSFHDRRLRRVIELAHLEPRRGELEYLEAMHVSRATWFRLLREARERVLAHRD